MKHIFSVYQNANSTNDKITLILDFVQIFLNLKMPYTWTRPENLDFPLTYLNFQSQDEEVEYIVNYRVEDLQENRFDEVLSILSDLHLQEESMYSSKKVVECPQSMREMIENWKNMLRQKISLVCYKEGSDEIVAVNILGVTTEVEFDVPHNVSYEFCKNFTDLFFSVYGKAVGRS